MQNKLKPPDGLKGIEKRNKHRLLNYQGHISPAMRR